MNKLRESNTLLAALTERDFALLAPHLTKVRLISKDILQHSEAPILHAYFVLEGMISLVARLSTGEEIEIGAIGREGAIGTKLGVQPPLSFAQALVQLPGTALRMEAVKFQQIALSSLGIVHLATCANEILAANLQQSAACNAIHGIEARLARWLLHARDRYDHDEMPLAHEFLSQMLGVRRSTVSLAAHTLQAAGVISYRRGKISITNREALEAISCECYNTVQRNVKLLGEFAKAGADPAL